MRVEHRRIAKIVSVVALAAALCSAPALRTDPIRAAGLPADISALLETAQHQFNSGNYGIAVVTLRSAVLQNPSTPEAYYWLGRSYYEMRDPDNAIVQLEKAVALESRNSLYHQWLGRAYGAKADRDKSFFLAKKVKKEFEEAVRLNQSSIAARRDLESYCISAPWIVGGSKDEAREQVEAIAQLDPIEGHLARGALYQEGKKLELAEDEYRQVLAAKPTRLEPYLEVAGFFQGQNRPADVQAAIEAAAQVKSNDPRLAFFQGVALVLSGADFGHAEEYLKSYLASTPDRSDWPSHAAAREWLGRLYEAQGKRAEAAEQYRASLELDSTRSQARARLQKLEKASP